VSGEEDIRTYKSSSRNLRVFCGVCGSTILVDPLTEPDMLYLSMSTVDGDPPRPLGYHAFVGSKAPWHEIHDKLEQYDTYSTV